MPWFDAPLSVDFDVEVRGLAITCTVREGGFPREWVQSLRFSLGDGFAGYGETVTHEFQGAGVYPVDLVVRLDGYRVVRASKLAVVTDGAAPGSKLSLTVNEIPAFLNGTVPFPSNNNTPFDTADDYEEAFTLLVPRDGFTVDLTLLDVPGGELDRASLTLTADVALADGTIPAGTDLADKVSFERGATDVVPRGTWRVDVAERFPTGPVTLTATARDASGAEHTQAITLEVTELTSDIDPFDRPMVWLLRFDMDLFTVGPTDAGGVMATAGADGMPDFAQELAAIGAQGDESAAGAATVAARGVVGANAIFERWVIAEMIADIRRYFGMAPDGTPRDGISMDIYAAGDAGAPDPASFDTNGSFSMMRIGGTLVNNFGRSKFSIHNETRVDDTTADLGVGSTRIIDALVAIPVIGQEFLPVLPGSSIGVPVGQHDQDATVLAADFDRYALDNADGANLRYDDLALIARELGMAIASVAAHEMGHAMGLVPNGPPPYGFFGGRADVTFLGVERTNSHHVDFPFLNLMQAGGNPLVILQDALDVIETPDDYDLADMVRLLAVENRLSPYSRAYFKRALTYSSFNGP